MPYTVEMRFDAKSASQIREIWDLLAQKNICNYMVDSNMTPHITLTVFNEIDNKLVTNKLQNFRQEIKPVEISFSHVGSFLSEQGIVFLAPTVTRELLELHQKFHNYFADVKEKQVEYYLPDNWVPHCTVAINVSDCKVAQAIEEIVSNYQPLNATIESISFVKYQPPEMLSKFSLETN